MLTRKCTESGNALGDIHICNSPISPNQNKTVFQADAISPDADSESFDMDLDFGKIDSADFMHLAGDIDYEQLSSESIDWNRERRVTGEDDAIGASFLETYPSANDISTETFIDDFDTFDALFPSDEGNGFDSAFELPEQNEFESTGLNHNTVPSSNNWYEQPLGPLSVQLPVLNYNHSLSVPRTDTIMSHHEQPMLFDNTYSTSSTELRRSSLAGNHNTGNGIVFNQIPELAGSDSVQYLHRAAGEDFSRQATENLTVPHRPHLLDQADNVKNGETPKKHGQQKRVSWDETLEQINGAQLTKSTDKEKNKQRRPALRKSLKPRVNYNGRDSNLHARTNQPTVSICEQSNMPGLRIRTSEEQPLADNYTGLAQEKSAISEPQFVSPFQESLIFRPVEISNKLREVFAEEGTATPGTPRHKLLVELYAVSLKDKLTAEAQQPMDRDEWHFGKMPRFSTIARAGPSLNSLTSLPEALHVQIDTPAVSPQQNSPVVQISPRQLGSETIGYAKSKRAKRSCLRNTKLQRKESSVLNQACEAQKGSGDLSLPCTQMRAPEVKVSPVILSHHQQIGHQIGISAKRQLDAATRQWSETGRQVARRLTYDNNGGLTARRTSDSMTSPRNLRSFEIVCAQAYSKRRADAMQQTQDCNHVAKKQRVQPLSQKVSSHHQESITCILSMCYVCNERSRGSFSWGPPLSDWILSLSDSLPSVSVFQSYFCTMTKIGLCSNYYLSE